MAFSSEGRLIYTESTAPAKVRLPETIVEAAGDTHFGLDLLIVFWGAPLTSSALRIYYGII